MEYKNNFVHKSGGSMDISSIQPQLHDNILFVGIILGALIALCISAFIIYISLRVKKIEDASSSLNPAHKTSARKQEWRKKIESIVEDYHSGALSHDQACAKLASVARKYVSALTGKNITTCTLSEISSLRNKLNNKIGADKLRQTITALYPPEFADLTMNSQAKETSVDDAAQWVLSLLEGWSNNNKNAKSYKSKKTN